MHKAKPVHGGPEDADPPPVESLAHHSRVGRPPTELDRALGYEANYAGTSFLTTDKLGKFEFGAKTVNIVGDKTQEQGAGDVRLRRRRREDVALAHHQGRHLRRLPDDPRPGAPDRPEGVARLQLRRQLVLDPVPAHAQRLARARREGRHRAGHHRARPTTASTSRGTASYSIDHQRYNFQFSGQTFWEVKKGKITTQLRDVPTSRTRRSSGSRATCSGGKSTYELGGAFNDGKGQPGQSNAVSHGCPIARFARVNVLNTGR